MKEHQKKYYGSLLFIVVLIVATAVVLQKSGSDDIWKGDVTGMAAAPSQYKSLLESGGSFYMYAYYSRGGLEKWSGSYDRGQYLLKNIDSGEITTYSSYENFYEAFFVIYSSADAANAEVYDSSLTRTENYNYGDQSLLVTSPSTTTVISTATTRSTSSRTTAIAEPVTTTAGTTTRTTTTLPTENVVFAKTEGTKKITIYSAAQTDVGANQIDGQVFIEDTNSHTLTAYNLIDVRGRTYFATSVSGTTILVDLISGHKYEQQGDVLYKVAETSNDLSSELLDSIYSAAFTDSATNEDLKVAIQGAAKRPELLTEEEQKRKNYETIAAELGLGEEGAARIQGEDEAVNGYLSNTLKEKSIYYDVSTNQYFGTTNGVNIVHDSNGNTGTAIIVSKNDQSMTYYVFKEKAGFGEATYSYCTSVLNGICNDPKPYTGENTEGFSEAIEKAKKEERRIQDAVQEEMRRCKNNNLVCTLMDGDTRITATARQEAYMNKIYEQQEAQVKGLLTGWLNNFIENGCCGWGGLGGWSRGVPADICASIFGLEYYKQDGWTRVPRNASADQLQSKLIANSRTVIIEGEKEEITESLFRYAYTMKLLANESVEWQTYMYNSCTAETSVDVFYDYGYLAPGAYFSFHYAGAGDVDMIFDCTQEDCLYDQACVAFTDGSAPTCVSLVHGAGFESPDAGSDYDCI